MSHAAFAFNPNNYSGTDSECFEQALADLKAAGGGTLHVSARTAERKDHRNYWLLDRALLLESNTSLIIDNCTLKLSDQCRDNFIRSGNCGLGITNVETMTDIHILGIGNAKLIGADHPRATGDSGKQLGERTYGTDAGKTDMHPKGNWQNIGVLMAYVRNFSVRNLEISDSHCWAMSFEHCSNGILSNLRFSSTSFKMIDGKEEKILNQDGIDLRQGCHDIVIDTVMGHTGDDLIALTAIGNHTPAGSIDSTMVSGTLPTGDDDIYNVTIRNVIGCSAGCCNIVRFLNNFGCRIHHIILDGLLDISPENHRSSTTIRIGDSNPRWGGVTPLGDTFGFLISNVQSNSNRSIFIPGSLADSIISNVMNHNPDCAAIIFDSGRENTRNIVLNAVV